MKKVISIAIALLLSVSFWMTASAAESSVVSEGNDGFSIEEMPEFGDVDEVIFPEEETGTPTESLADESTVARAETSETEDNPQDDPMKENVQEAGESTQTDASPTLETAKTSSEINYLPVIIIVAVLVVGAIIILLIRKSKPTEHKHLQK